MQTRSTLRIGDFDVEPSLDRLSKGPETLTVEPRVMDLLFSVSKDHRWLAYAQASSRDGDIILIEG